jgi:hypothetical protein
MKNVFFTLVFMLVGTFAFASNDSVENLKFGSTTETSFNLISVDDLEVGLCVFSFTLTATNQVTGEVITREYTQTANVSSESECRAYAQTTMMMQARLFEAQLN